jgi:hypothetical protein
MKKLLGLTLILALLALLPSCGEKKILHCDGCGREVEVAASSRMEEEWIVFCEDCEKGLGLSSILGE